MHTCIEYMHTFIRAYVWIGERRGEGGELLPSFPLFFFLSLSEVQLYLLFFACLQLFMWCRSYSDRDSIL